MKVQVLRSAMEDLAADPKFYDRQEAIVGDYFFDSLFTEIDSLALYAGAIHFGFHRLLAKRFPYTVYYRIIDDKAIVFRILDCRPDPSQLRKVLGGAD
jgi:plasmid stabilization system protein ParE